jgi:putative nucleotidyltransferase with HDIG domain
MTGKLLFVDDDIFILDSIKRMLEDSSHEVVLADSAEAALLAIEEESFAVVFSDNRMPGMSGIELLQEIRRRAPKTVRNLMTAYVDTETILNSINKGEVFRFLAKPWKPEGLFKCIEDSIQRHRAIEMLAGPEEAVLMSLARTVELKDPYAKGHSVRVASYAVSLATEMGLPESILESILQGSWLHDCGKIGVPETILNKKGPLDDGQMQIIRNHPLWGADVARIAKFPEDAIKIVLHHHEHYAGTGYPDGLKGQEIPLEARVVSVADVYDALTTSRSYRGQYSRPRARRILLDMKGSTLDPEIVDRFLAIEEGISTEDFMQCKLKHAG